MILIILLTYLFSVEPERKKKPKSKTHKSNSLLVEKFHLEVSSELCHSGILPNIKSWFKKQEKISSIQLLIFSFSLEFISAFLAQIQTRTRPQLVWGVIPPFSRSTLPFLRLPLSRNPRCLHLSEVCWENKSTE